LTGPQKSDIKVEKITNIIIKTESKEGKKARPDNRSTESTKTARPTYHPSSQYIASPSDRCLGDRLTRAPGHL